MFPLLNRGKKSIHIDVQNYPFHKQQLEKQLE
jgi:hypothetical protein